MPAPFNPDDFKALIPSGSESICTSLTKSLVRLPAMVYKMVKFMFKDDGTLADEFVELIPGVVPVQDTGAAPAAPTGLTASNDIAGYIRLNWSASPTATSYKVYRNTTDNSATATLLGTSTAAVYNDATGTISTTYYYWIKATNSNGDSGFSESASGYFTTAAKYVTVTTSATYTVTDTGTMNIYAWAGGGGGGTGYIGVWGGITLTGGRACGGGGGGGSYADKLAIAVVVGDVIGITVGTGGSPGAQGGDTVVTKNGSEIIHCCGGRPGGNYYGTTGGAGGAGGSSTAGDNQQSGNSGAAGTISEPGGGGTSKEVVGINDGGVHGSGGRGGSSGSGSYGNPGIVKYLPPPPA